jgi:hypothetical protein
MIPGRCTGTALVYSGRPDPQWKIENQSLQGLKKIWEELPPSRTPPPRPPLLGYRGCWVQCPSGEQWLAYAGIVALKLGAGRSRYRLDKDRRFERAALETAPPKRLPEEFRIPQ